jgi:glycosyltransferase involved in cell wall biosynthesis
VSLAARAIAALLRPDIAIFHVFQRGPYGGSNQFLRALRVELSRRGYSVRANLIGRRTRGAILNAFAFDETRLRAMRHSGCRIVHRVDGPVASYRGSDDGSDRRVAALNREFADVTIFQSRYSLEAHRAIGLGLRNPVTVPNAVDPRIFHATGRIAWSQHRKVRLVSSSWSDNPNKGAATYQWIEDNLDWDRYEYTFVGRSPVRFRRIRTLGPLPSPALARMLRQHDVYVTASVNDPASNALLEALACGLPALYLRSGGHAEITRDGGLGFDAPEQALEHLERLVADYLTFQSAIEVPGITEVTTAYLDAMGMAAH